MPVDPRNQSLGGIPLRQIIFGALIAQNVALTILMYYSRNMPLINGDRYYASTAVFLTETIKLAFFLSIALYEIATSPLTPETSTISEISNALSKAVFTGDSWKLAIPAVLFTAQNSLQYVAASNLDAATFSATYQLKTVSTAIFAALLMGRALNVKRWLSLGLMTFGVAIVQMSQISKEGRVLSVQDLKDGTDFTSPRSIWEMESAGNAAAAQLNKRSATYEGIDEDFAAANPRKNAMVGLAAAVAACIFSGIACVYFEKTLKSKSESKVSVWIRNVQLSFYSVWPSLFLGVLFHDGEHLARTGFFTGYNWVVLVVILLQAAGGVLVAFSLATSDSVTKSFATSISAGITFVISAIFLDFHTTFFYLLGIVATGWAAFMYNFSSNDKRSRPPPISVTQYEKGNEPGYFDLEAVATAGKSPLRDSRREGLSTSRPGTPVIERNTRSKSSERRAKKP